MSYFKRFIDEGTQHVALLDDKRRVRSVNYVFVYSLVLLPAVLVLNLIQRDFSELIYLLFQIVVVVACRYLNIQGRYQAAVYLLNIGFIVLVPAVVFHNRVQSAAPLIFVFTSIANTHILKPHFWRGLVNTISLIELVVLVAYQIQYFAFKWEEQIMVIPILLLFYKAMLVNETEHTKNRQEIERQNEQLLAQQETIRQQTEEVMALQETQHQQELAHKQQANEALLEKNNLVAQQKEELHLMNEKLIALGEFKEAMTGMIVHDLKNPLNAIIGLSNQLTDTDRSKLPQMINQSGLTMLNMVLNILDVQKFEASEVQVQPDSQALIRLANTAHQDVLFLLEQKNLQVRIQIPDHAWVMAEEELIVRVLTNMLTNAIKYAPPGSSIDIYTEALSPDQTQIKVWVKDYGIGIAKDKQDLVFRKFGQINSQSLGRARSSGLGLTFCKLAVEAHGGQIGVESEVGQSTSFWFTLPLGIPKGTHSPSLVPKPTTAEVSLFELNETEKALVQPILAELSGCEFFEFSKIKNTLAKLNDFDQPTILAIKEQLNMAFLNMNEQAFGELVKLGSE